MKEGNNNLLFIKNSFAEDDYLKSNIAINNKNKLDDSKLIKDLSITVKDNDNENNIIILLFIIIKIYIIILINN